MYGDNGCQLTISNMGKCVIICEICECIETNFLIGMSPDSEQIARKMAFRKCGDVLCLYVFLRH